MKLHLIVEFPKGHFLECEVSPSKFGSHWSNNRHYITDMIDERLLRACVEGEDLRVMDFEHAVVCMQKTLAGNKVRELKAASVPVGEYIEKNATQVSRFVCNLSQEKC